MKNNKPKEEKSKKNKKKDRGRRKPRNCSSVTMTSQQLKPVTGLALSMK